MDTSLCHELSHEEIIHAIDTLSFDDFDSTFKDTTCTKFSHPDILLHLMLRIHSLKLRQSSPQHSKLVRFLTVLFKETCKQSDLETLQKFLELRLSHGSLGVEAVEYKRVGKKKSFTLLLNQITTDEKTSVYKRLVCKVLKWASFAPVETVLLLIDRAISTPSLIPTIAQILTRQLRPIVMTKVDKSPRTLMSSLLNYKLFFSIESGNHQLQQSKFNSCFVQFTKEFFKARYLKSQSCVVNIEAIVIEWLTVVKAFPSTALTQIDILNQLIESNLGGKLLWSYISLSELLLYFVTCIIELRKRANVKEVFLSTVQAIMKRHIQRKISANEVDQLFTQVEPCHYILLTYFNELSVDKYILQKINLHCYFSSGMSEHQILLLASIIGPDDILMQKALLNVVESVKCILPFMTSNEIVNLFAFLSSIYGMKCTVDFFVSAMAQFSSSSSSSSSSCRNSMHCIDWTYVVSSFDLALRLLAFREEQNHSYENTGDDINPSVILQSDQLDAHFPPSLTSCTSSSSSPAFGPFDGKKFHNEKSEYESTYRENQVTLIPNADVQVPFNGEGKGKGISELLSRLLLIVPLDCRAIVCKLQQDCSALEES